MPDVKQHEGAKAENEETEEEAVLNLTSTSVLRHLPLLHPGFGDSKHGA